LIQAEAMPASATAPFMPAHTKEQMLMTITAKNFGDTEVEEKFIEQIASLAFFKKNLRKTDPIILKNRLPRQVDPLDSAKTFTLFSIECRFAERALGHD